jgi:hypothetical protein
LDGEILVKAVDKSGNERIVVIPPKNQRPWYKSSAALIVFLLAVALWQILKRRMK